MLNNEEIIQIAENIKKDYPKESQDFVDAFEWFSLAIDGVLTSIGNQLPELHKQNNYSRIIDLANFSSKLNKMQEEVVNLSSYFESLEEENNELIEDDENDQDKKPLINYEDYAVDRQIPHTLYEDFKHTKACAFSLFGNVYEAKNMRDVLVQTCAILASIDVEKIESFINDSSMKGRTVTYFGTNLVTEDSINKNEKIPGTELYVWVNLSCNHIRNILRKMLKKYGINFNEYKIFLRADFSDLHENQKSHHNTTDYDDTEKIGKHVSNCMRILSNKKYSFTANEIKALQSDQWCKSQFNIYGPLIKKYDETKDVSSQIKVNNHPRYWKDIFIFNDEKYFVTSQWYERHRLPFDNWFNNLKVGD